MLRLTGLGGGGGWVGILMFIERAHLRDATLLHVLFNVFNYVMLRYCTFSSMYSHEDHQPAQRAAKVKQRNMHGTTARRKKILYFELSPP